MPDSVSLRSFPEYDFEALAYLYVEKHITPQDSIDDIAEMYFEASHRFREKLRDLYREKRDRERNSI